MKVLLVSVKSDVSRGGIAVWTGRFLSACSAFGIDCDLVNTEMVGKRRESGAAKRNYIDEIIRTRRIFRDIKGCLGKKEYDAAHLNTSCGTFGLFRDYIVAKNIKKKGIRLVTHFHCDIPYWIRNPISKKYLAKLVALSDETLVLCESSRLYLEECFGAPSVKVPNFIDDSLIITHDKIIAETLATAVFVGRVEEAKGMRELWELAKRFPKINFKLVGDVSDTVRAWKKPENITLVGSLSHKDTIAEMDKADLFIFPSRSEGFSLALTEAMARGLPAVATDVGANADMLADGCGIITAVGGIDAMEKAIEKLADAGVRSEMSKCSAAKARQQYVTETIIEKLKVYYEASEEIL